MATVSSSEVSPASQAVEASFRGHFFKLLFVSRRMMSLPQSSGWTPVEKTLTMDCLDEMNCRYADVGFLLAFTIGCTVRGRVGSLWTRYRFPFYLGLVGYDASLRLSEPFPAIHYWNDVSAMDTELGRCARALYTSSLVYDVPIAHSSVHSQASYLSWLGDSASFLLRSLFLQKLASHVFEGSCWDCNVPLMDGAVLTGGLTPGRPSPILGLSDSPFACSRLVVNSRFFRWQIFEYRRHVDDLDVDVIFHILPTLSVSRWMRHTYRSRDTIQEYGSFGAKLWYGFHFAVIRLLRLSDVRRDALL